MKLKHKETDGRTKLTDKEVAAMRRRYKAGFTRGKRNEHFVSQSELAKENNISVRRAVSILNKQARA